MEKKQILFATTNEGKLGEIRAILEGTDIEVISLKDAGIDIEVIEDGTTFRENAVIKAEAIMKATGKLTLADDSGLEVDFLNKEPGIYSARYCGVNTPYKIKNRNILERLTDVPDEKRTARFVCAIAAAYPDGETVTVQATMEGRIGYEETGLNGFGYDPIFYLPEYGCYSAQLPPEKKNEISHRGKALRMMAGKILENTIKEKRK
ncbi:MAG: XTP/dITP diphosphatase [Lachnospiraceae bacterium]|nr:XTP/dITP diphosphatase [Lachnospiraceae bacterium]